MKNKSKARSRFETKSQAFAKFLILIKSVVMWRKVWIMIACQLFWGWIGSLFQLIIRAVNVFLFRSILICCVNLK